MISKELLSEVLGEEVFEFEIAEDDRTMLWFSTTKDPDIFQAINIHELATKCKEWAFENNFVIKSFCEDDGEHDGGFCGVAEIGKIRFEQYREHEAIFKACQWILDNKVKD